MPRRDSARETAAAAAAAAAASRDGGDGGGSAAHAPSACIQDGRKRGRRRCAWPNDALTRSDRTDGGVRSQLQRTGTTAQYLKSDDRCVPFGRLLSSLEYFARNRP